MLTSIFQGESGLRIVVVTIVVLLHTPTAPTSMIASEKTVNISFPASDIKSKAAFPLGRVKTKPG